MSVYDAANPFAERYAVHITPTAVVEAFASASTLLEIQQELRIQRDDARHLAGDLGLRADHPGTGLASNLTREDVEEAVAQVVRAHREASEGSQ